MGRNKSTKQIIQNSTLKNVELYNYYFNRMLLICYNRFEWVNIPDSMSERFLEKTLHNEGKAVIYYDNNIGLINLQVNKSGKLNFYEDATKYTISGINYPNKTVDANNCVIVKNNSLCTPTVMWLHIFAERFYIAHSALLSNVNMQKFAAVIKTNDRTKFSLTNMLEQYQGNIPFIIVNDTFEMDNFQALKFDVPFIADKLCDELVRIWNDFYTFIGINNSNIEKRAQVNTEEVTSNNEAIALNGYTFISSRQLAANLCNKMYGTNITVRPRATNDYNVEAEINGNIYNSIKNLD